MVIINNKRWITLDDEMLVNGKKIIAIFSNEKRVYPSDDYSYITYGIMLGSYTPLEAEAICVENGGHLASVHSLEENNFISMCRNSITNSPVFLGGSDYGSEGQWYWLDGTDWDFTNWFSGEPNNGLGRGQDYIQLIQVGKWDDCYGGYYYEHLPFVCKWNKKIEPSSVDENFHLFYYKKNNE